jgi:hypothetical protein
MARITKKQLQAQVDEKMPGYRVVEEEKKGTDAPRRPLNADASTPDLDALRRKYLGTRTDSANQPASRAARPARRGRLNITVGSTEESSAGSTDNPGNSDDDNDDEEMVTLEPKSSSRDAGRAPARKIGITSGDKLKGAQG